MPFIVTTTHTIPDDAPVTAGMLSDVLRPSRWAGLPVGTASTARVDFVAARPIEPKLTVEMGMEAADAALREAQDTVKKLQRLLPEFLNFRHPRDPDAAFRG